MTLRDHRFLVAALALAIAAITGAWIFELGFGYLPCKLCLWQRWPYYIGIPLGLTALACGGVLRPAGRWLQGATALVFVAGAAIAVYHAGAEWGFWPGPSDCGGRIAAGPANVLDLRNSIRATKIIRCDEAALRILGLSFAGWNVLTSLAIAALAAVGIMSPEPRRQGSSSESQ